VLFRSGAVTPSKRQSHSTPTSRSRLSPVRRRTRGLVAEQVYRVGFPLWLLFGCCSFSWSSALLPAPTLSLLPLNLPARPNPTPLAPPTHRPPPPPPPPPPHTPT